MSTRDFSVIHGFRIGEPKDSDRLRSPKRGYFCRGGHPAGGVVTRLAWARANVIIGHRHNRQSAIMAEHEHWQLDGSAPQLYQRYLVPAITSHWADDLMARALPRAGETVLDLACGTGAVARVTADRMTNGRVVGL